MGRAGGLTKMIFCPFMNVLGRILERKSSTISSGIREKITAQQKRRACSAAGDRSVRHPRARTHASRCTTWGVDLEGTRGVGGLVVIEIAFQHLWALRARCGSLRRGFPGGEKCGLGRAGAAYRSGPSKPSRAGFVSAKRGRRPDPPAQLALETTKR